MTYETLNSIYVIAGIASLVMLAVTAGLFFLLKIPEAVAFISGRTRKKGIEAIQRTGSAGSTTGGKKSKEQKKSTKAAKSPVEIAKKAPPQAPVQEKMTDVLPTAGEKNTEVLSSAESLTTVLDVKYGTEILESAQVNHQNLIFTQQPFVVEFDITYVYSDIIIEEA